MEKDLSEIKIHLAEIKVDLKHHMKRTELLEGEVREWRKDIAPIQKHIGMVNGVGKIIIALTAVITAAAAAIALL